jgi:hypothetical protein
MVAIISSWMAFIMALFRINRCSSLSMTGFYIGSNPRIRIQSLYMGFGLATGLICHWLLLPTNYYNTFLAFITMLQYVISLLLGYVSLPALVCCFRSDCYGQLRKRNLRLFWVYLLLKKCFLTSFHMLLRRNGCHCGTFKILHFSCHVVMSHCVQQHAFMPSSKPDESSIHTNTLLLKIYFNIIFLLYV